MNRTPISCTFEFYFSRTTKITKKSLTNNTLFSACKFESFASVCFIYGRGRGSFVVPARFDIAAKYAVRRALKLEGRISANTTAVFSAFSAASVLALASLKPANVK